MLQIVERLRALKLRETAVQAHLWSSTTTLPPPQPVDYAAVVTGAALQLGLPLQRKKNRKRGKKKKGKHARSSSAVEDQSKINRPPSLEEFPTLNENTVEWAAPLVDNAERTKTEEQVATESHDDEEKEEEDPSSRVGKAHSDAASTATTTSSSTESGPHGKKVLGGYAAAVLKTSKPTSYDTVSSSIGSLPTVSGGSREKDVAAINGKNSENGPVVIEPPSWGQGRSFADAAKTATEEETTTS